MSRLVDIRRHFTISETAGLLTREMNEPVSVTDVAELIVDGKLCLHYLPETGSAPMQEVISACIWPPGGVCEAIPNQFFTVPGKAVEYLQGIFLVENTRLISEQDLEQELRLYDRLSKDHSAEIDEDMFKSLLPLDPSLVHDRDLNGVLSAGLIVSDTNSGTLYQVLRGESQSKGHGWDFFPLVLPIEDAQFRIESSQIRRLLHSQPSDTRSQYGQSEQGGSDGRVYWRALLSEHFPTMCEKHGKAPTFNQAMRYLKDLNNPRVTVSQDLAGLTWVDDFRSKKTVSKKTVNNALSALRQRCNL